MSRALSVFVLSMLTTLPAFAQATSAPNPILGTVVPVIFMLGVMYILMIRPQMKKQKDHQSFITTLERGTEVVTTSGILGRIEGLTDVYVTLEIAPGTKIKILRTAIAGSAKSFTATASTEVKA